MYVIYCCTTVLMWIECHCFDQIQLIHFKHLFTGSFWPHVLCAERPRWYLDPFLRSQRGRSVYFSGSPWHHGSPLDADP